MAKKLEASMLDVKMDKMRGHKTADTLSAQPTTLGNSKIIKRGLFKTDCFMEFSGHPFKIKDDARMQFLRNSIKSLGFVGEVIARPNKDKKGTYEMLSGHRRRHAAELEGLKEIPAVIIEADDDTATKLMILENLGNRDIAKSELGAAFKMYLDRYRDEGKSYNDALKEIISDAAEQGSDISRSSIIRLMRLNDLYDPFVEKVDSGDMAISVAEHLSQLKEEEQVTLWNYLQEHDVKLDITNAQKLKEISKKSNLTESKINDFFFPKKPAKVKDKAYKVKSKEYGFTLTIDSEETKSILSKYPPKEVNKKFEELFKILIEGFEDGQ